MESERAQSAWLNVKSESILSRCWRDSRGGRRSAGVVKAVARAGHHVNHLSPFSHAQYDIERLSTDTSEDRALEKEERRGNLAGRQALEGRLAD